MNTLKSAALVVVCTGVCVAVYLHLHQPNVTPPHGMTQRDIDDLGPPQVEEGSNHQAPDHQYPGQARGGKSSLAPTPDQGRSVYDPRVVTPAIPDVSESNPADPPPHSEGRSLSHSEPIPGDRSFSSSIYGSPFPGEGRENLAGPAAGAPAYDAEAAARRLALHSFKRSWEKARQQIDEGQFRAALATLSPYYGQPDLPAEHQAQLVAWLDALAAKVIYSREHLLTKPYKVRGSQARMIDVATEFNVTAQLLQNINAQTVNNPDVLLPGTELKVVPGPFRAVVDLSRNEITVFLNDLYAGRFPFSRGDEPIQPGQYQVQRKKTLPTYVGRDSRTVAGNDPANPYGMFCLDLGSEVRIHGSPLIGQSGKPRGCISLSPKDAEDLYGILTVGSPVAIK